MTLEKIKELTAALTLEEKAGLLSGGDFWHTKEVERLSIPKVMVSDGPHGLRKQDDRADHLGVNESIQAVCFPAGCATACSFDRELMERIGEALGTECQAEGVGILLGPAVNIKRSPLCGRNFEYYSEDPYLASELAAGFIRGVQSRGVGTSLKHFLANNQEYQRMTSDSRMDERTMREIYLAAFEGAVKEAKPWTVMCSYNKVNGVYASENYQALTEILRNEWGFDGFVISDWGAVSDRTESVKAGLELEMPPTDGLNDRAVLEAVKSGRLSEAVLNRAVERILEVVYRYEENKDRSAVFDRAAHHELAREAEENAAVLLKNEGALPLNPADKTAFIGAFAEKPRYQGGGSSHINSHRVTAALEAAGAFTEVIYARGYDPLDDRIEEDMIEEAVAAARRTKTAVIFAGLPDAYESEGYDRSHMRLPDNQNELIRRVAEVSPAAVVVLHTGSPVEMPWADKVKGILCMYLGGQAVGAAACSLLFGRVNPSGKLAETFPRRLADNPSYLFYHGEEGRADYREGIFVGYRYYDKKEMEVLFPFGHGLSYTTFLYENLRLDKKSMKDTDTLTVSLDVTNTGSMAGKEAVELYVRDKKCSYIRPDKELKEFSKVALKPGETKTVTFHLNKRAFAYYNPTIHGWHVESGAFDILIGKSSRDIVLSAAVTVESTEPVKKNYDKNSMVGEFLEDKERMEILKPLLEKYRMGGEDDVEKEALGASTAVMVETMMREMPLRNLLHFSGGRVSPEEFEACIRRLNGQEAKAFNQSLEK